MLFKKDWLSFTPPHARPNEKIIRQLDRLRAELKIPPKDFAIRVLMAPSTVRKAQRVMLDNLRVQYPGKSERHLFRMLVDSTLNSLRVTGSYPVNLPATDEAMANINSFSDLCNFIISLDTARPEFSDKFGIGGLVQDILESEESEKRALAMKLITEIQHIYMELKEKHPEQDEHWYLANAWLKRYGSTPQAEEKGTKKTNFIASKETFSFSILNWPDSITALSYFLVYKELGQEYAWLYNSAFNQIMELTTNAMENSTFLDIYKLKNPKLWAENQIEGDAFSLWALYRGIELTMRNRKD